MPLIKTSDAQPPGLKAGGARGRRQRSEGRMGDKKA